MPEDADQQAEIDRAALFLTTEHMALQTARAATVFEANGRVGLYIGSLSSVVVALAFIGQASGLSSAFFVFGVVLLPSAYCVGFVTFVRVLQSGTEDIVYFYRIERIRRFYVDVSPLAERYLESAATADEDRFSPRALLFSWRWQRFLTSAGMVAIVNSVVAGGFGGLLAAWLVARSLPLGIAVGAACFVVSELGHVRFLTAAWQTKDPPPDVSAENETSPD